MALSPHVPSEGQFFQAQLQPCIQVAEILLTSEPYAQLAQPTM